MDTQTVKQIVKEELPKLVRSDKRIRKFVLELSKEVSLEKADKKETESRFDRILEELKQDREEQNRKWAEQNKKWDENQEEIRELLKKVEKQDTSLGALGARWGIRAESSFRNALKGILEGNFDVKVLNINEYDEQQFKLMLDSNQPRCLQ